MKASIVASVAAALALGPRITPVACSAQEPDSVQPRIFSVRAFPSIHSWEAEAPRVAELIGDRPVNSSLLYSPSAALRSRRPDILRPEFQLFLPTAEVRWNSDIPFSMNDGAVRAERGLNTAVIFGFRAAWGPFSAVIAPEYLNEENRDFVPLDPRRSGDFLIEARRDSLSTPWYSFQYGADIPLRFGYERRELLLPGQSTLSAEVGPITVGASTENHWWGPGVRNALVMSNNAPGVPHAFARTSRPLRTRIGDVEAVWLAGELRESEHFDTTAANNRRALSSFALTYRPAGEPNLQLGLARSVYSALEAPDRALSRLTDVFSRWDMRGDVDPRTLARHEQIASVFGRWVFPDDGLAIYGEWARQRLPEDIGDLLEHPGFSQGYTLGFEAAREPIVRGTLRIRGELSYLEQTRRSRQPGSFYTSPHITQGYTHEGQIIGAAIGPGASSQWLAADYLAGTWRAGLFGGRIRWDNDAYYTKRSGPRDYYGHDVSMLAGVRLGSDLPLVRIDAEFASEMRYNYHYQNFAFNWDTADDAVDVPNRIVRLSVTPLLFVRRPALPRPVPVAPVQDPAAPPSVAPSVDPALSRPD